MSESPQDSAQNGEITERDLEDLLSEFEEPTDVFEETGRVSVDTLFDALSHPGRRYVVTYLLLRDEFVSLSEMVDFVTGLIDEPDPGGRFREEVVTELVQRHLPKLADARLVEYRVERQFIGPTDLTTAALPYLHLALKQATEFEPDEE